MSLRERKKEQTQLDLTRAALELFDERGFDATTVEDIAERANYSRSTFFRYFVTKEDVLFGGIPRNLVAYRERLEELHATEPPWTVLRKVFVEYALMYLAEDPELPARSVALWLAEPGLRRRFFDVIREWEEVSANFLRSSGIEDFEARILAAALLAVGRTVTEARLSDAGDIRRRLDFGFDLLEEGIKSHAAMLSRSEVRE